MGRGRAKAKQAKVARELKYQSPNTDLSALQRELSGARRPSHVFEIDASDVEDLDQDEEFPPPAPR